MADPKLGTLAARVFVDRGRQPHYGADDVVTGKVLLSYLPYKSIFKKNTVTADFFGPLKIEATLRGKVSVKVKRSRDTVISSDYGSRLFMHSFDVFEGSFRAEVGHNYEFPFVVGFPASTGGCPIPPSFAIYFSDYPDRVNAAVRYRLGAKMTTPGIKVETSTPDFDPEPEIRYDLPRPPQSLLNVPGRMVQQKVVIQNQNLLPETERPSGLRQTFKAAFSTSSFPKFTANISCTSIQYACPGLKPRFSLAVRAVDSETTAAFFPDVNLHAFGISLMAHTTVDTSERVLASKSCLDTHTAQKLSPSRSSTSPPTSLSKANDHCVEIEMDPFGLHPSSFAHPKISREYLLEIKARLTIAGTSVAFSQQFPVEMLPPPDHSGLATLGDFQPGPSRTSVDTEIQVKNIASEETDQPPPAYNDPEPIPPPLDTQSKSTLGQ